MVIEGKTAAFAVGKPDKCGQRTRRYRDLTHGRFNRITQQSARQSRWITVEDNILGGNSFATCQFDGSHRPITHINPAYRTIVAEYHALRFGQFLKRRCQCAHPAFNRPYTLSFYMSDQHQGGGGLKR
jgi:hypothetical protein